MRLSTVISPTIAPWGVRKAIARRIFKRAASLQANRRWSASATAYRLALDWDPRRPGPWNQYGHVLKESGRLDLAVDAYRRAISIDPEKAEFHFQLGDACERQENAFDALMRYRRAAELDPDHPFAAGAATRIEDEARKSTAKKMSAYVEFPFEEPDLV